MAQVIVNLTRVQVFENEIGSNVSLVFNEQIDGFERVIGDNGAVDFTETKVNTISIGRSALIAQLCELNDDIALYRSCLTHTFGQREFAIILHKAVLTLERERHSAGEVRGQDENGTDVCYERDCYTTTVVGVKLSDKSLKLLDGAITL